MKDRGATKKKIRERVKPGFPDTVCLFASRQVSAPGPALRWRRALSTARNTRMISSNTGRLRLRRVARARVRADLLPHPCLSLSRQSYDGESRGHNSSRSDPGAHRWECRDQRDSALLYGWVCREGGTRDGFNEERLMLCHFPPRHVILPKELAKSLPKARLLSEHEWRGIGVQQSRGWQHYAIHR